MVATARIGLDERVYGNFPARLEPGLAVQIQTAVLEAVDDQPRPEPAEEHRQAPEPQQLPQNSEPKDRRSSSGRRHLAGAGLARRLDAVFPGRCPNPSRAPGKKFPNKIE